jgi:hypothetical protein
VNHRIFERTLRPGIPGGMPVRASFNPQACFGIGELSPESARDLRAFKLWLDSVSQLERSEWDFTRFAKTLVGSSGPP